MDFIGNWIAGKLKLLLLGLALGGPFVGFAGWSEVTRVEHVLADGQEATARVTGGTRKARKGDDDYTVDLAWRDEAGRDRTARGVKVSRELSAKLFNGDRVVVERLRIKFVPSEDGRDAVVLLDDVAEQLELDRIMMWGGPIAGALGALGSAWTFGWLGRLRGRQRRPREEFVRDGRAILGEDR